MKALDKLTKPFKEDDRTADLFNGMSFKEMEGMPFMYEADYLKKTNLINGKVDRDALKVVASHQASYIAHVYASCPKWRWEKKKKLNRARKRAEVILKIASEKR